MVVLKKPYHCPPEVVRDACLFASAVNARKAQAGGFVDRGELGARGEPAPVRRRLRPAAAVRRGGPGARATLQPVDHGIWDGGDHYVLVTPAHIVPHPVATVGMGDTISSSAYYYEVCEAKS